MRIEVVSEEILDSVLWVSGVWLFFLVGMFWGCFCLLQLGDSTMGSLFLMLRLFILLTLLLLVGFS